MPDLRQLLLVQLTVCMSRTDCPIGHMKLPCPDVPAILPLQAWPCTKMPGNIAACSLTKTTTICQAQPQSLAKCHGALLTLQADAGRRPWTGEEWPPGTGQQQGTTCASSTSCRRPDQVSPCPHSKPAYGSCKNFTASNRVLVTCLGGQCLSSTTRWLQESH